MTSIFDLKTDISELKSANDGISKMEYDQHPPTRDVVGNNFANGAIHFRFEVSGEKWWIPSRTYFRMRCKLNNGATPPVQLTVGENIAPNMGLMSSLFQSGEVRINNKLVSRVSDFMPQVDALNTRTQKSSSWLESVGDSTNWWNESQSLRLAEVSSDGSIIKNTTAIVPADATTTRALLGFDVAGGATAGLRNSWAYTALDGTLVYSQGTDVNGLTPPQASVAFPVGSFFVYQGVVGTPPVEMEVLSNDGVGNLVVEPLLNNDVPADGRDNFSRVVKNTNILAPDSRRIGEFELIWQPPLSLFGVDHGLPSGVYEIVLNPQTSTSFQKRAIESTLGVASKVPTLVGGGVGDYKLEVVDFYLYCATVNGPRADNLTYLLDLEQTRCQSEKIDNTSFSQKNFDVSPSTFALTVAYQDVRCGNNTALSVSKFKSYNSPDIPTESEELKLNRFFINYSGQNLPQLDSDPYFDTGIDYTTQRYVASQMYTGAYFDSGGTETIEQFHERGAYYNFSIPKDGTDRSTRVNVFSGFQNTTDVANMRVLLFDHSRQVVRVKVQDGRVTDVQMSDA
tara:strand:- start:2022 stop:3722 length:1701 start_codon:yes stop_codon:yes gene_type:complete